MRALSDGQLRGRLRRLRNWERLETFIRVSSWTLARGAVVLGGELGMRRGQLCRVRGQRVPARLPPWQPVHTRRMPRPSTASAHPCLQLLRDCGKHELADEAQQRLDGLRAASHAGEPSFLESLRELVPADEPPSVFDSWSPDESAPAAEAPSFLEPGSPDEPAPAAAAPRPRRRRQGSAGAEAPPAAGSESADEGGTTGPRKGRPGGGRAASRADPQARRRQRIKQEVVARRLTDLGMEVSVACMQRSHAAGRELEGRLWG